MLYLIVYLFCLFSAIGCGLFAGWSDFRGMTIPNILPVVIVVSFFLAFGTLYYGEIEIFGSLKQHLIAGGFVLAATFLLFISKVIGGGDSKLLAAFALWVGTQGLIILLFYMAVFGAILGILALVIKKIKPFKKPPEGSWLFKAQSGVNSIPYGIPIALGAFIAFMDIGYVTSDALALFFVSE